METEDTTIKPVYKESEGTLHSPSAATTSLKCPYGITYEIMSLIIAESHVRDERINHVLVIAKFNVEPQHTNS